MQLIHPPTVSERLVAHLSQVFPNELPRDSKCTIEQVRLMQGAQMVIDHIKSMKANQED